MTGGRGLVGLGIWIPLILLLTFNSSAKYAPYLVDALVGNSLQVDRSTKYYRSKEANEQASTFLGYVRVEKRTGLTGNLRTMIRDRGSVDIGADSDHVGGYRFSRKDGKALFRIRKVFT